MKISVFNAMNMAAKQATLMHIKGNQARRLEDYLLALHALVDPDQQVRLSAKLVCQCFSEQSYYLDMKGLSTDEIRAKMEERFPELRDNGPTLIELSDDGHDPQKLAAELQTRAKKAESLNGDWEGPFPKNVALLNTLRGDTQQLITELLEQGETCDRAFIGFFTEQLEPFRECRRSLDSNAATSLVNLSTMRDPAAVSPGFAGMFGLLERPIYLLILLTSRRLVLFLRDQPKNPAAAVHAVACSMITQVTGCQTPLGYDIELETTQDLLKLPQLEHSDGLELEKLLRERSIDAGQPPEEPRPEMGSQEKDVDPKPAAVSTVQAPDEPAIPAPETPESCAEAFRTSILTGLEWYKQGVRLGRPRRPDIEAWFSHFVNHLQRNL
ncbi:MAG TPA: hypothetical protein PKM25_14095 [Candidatus Ozemobacteraceae bacterium]|nr:hypothetical protein [Candidatus Ozemobacteraceae bacterium]